MSLFGDMLYAAAKSQEWIAVGDIPYRGSGIFVMAKVKHDGCSYWYDVKNNCVGRLESKDFKEIIAKLNDNEIMRKEFVAGRYDILQLMWNGLNYLEVDHITATDLYDMYR